MLIKNAVTIGITLLTGLAVAQQLPGVIGHPESTLVDPDPANAPAGEYAIDNNHVAVLGKILHGNLAYLVFHFDPYRINGTYTYDPAQPETTQVEVTIESSSIDFGLPPFNERVVGAEFLNVESYPTIHFSSTEIRRDDSNSGTMTGDLTLHGVTKPFRFDVKFNGAGPSGDSIKMGFSATGSLVMADYGIDVSRNNVTDQILLMIEVEFEHQELETDVEQVRQLQAQ